MSPIVVVVCRCSILTTHVIDGGGTFGNDPEGLAFNLFGIHIIQTFHLLEALCVSMTKNIFLAQLILAVDSSGFSIIGNYNTRSLSIFIPTGKYVHPVQTYAGGDI